jgi:hypoxanthine phosphoribosyltransferase
MIHHWFPLYLHFLMYGTKATYSLLIGHLNNVNLSFIAFLDMASMYYPIVGHVGVIIRWYYIGLHWYNQRWEVQLILAICHIIYYWERNDRVKNNKRDAYGYLHAFEHIGLFIWLLNNNLTIRPQNQLIGIIIFMIFSPMITYKIVNIFIYYKWFMFPLPAWLIDTPLEVFHTKLSSNTFSTKKWNVFKFLNGYMTTKMVTWDVIEEDITKLVTQLSHEQFHCIIGISSGGAIIVPLLAKKLNCPYVVVYSKYWSNSELFKSIYQTCAHYSGMITAASISDAPKIIPGKGKLLIFDDSTCSGTTLKTVKQYYESQNHKDIVTAVLYASSTSCEADYTVTKGCVPFMYPWGFEMD